MRQTTYQIWRSIAEQERHSPTWEMQQAEERKRAWRMASALYETGQTWEARELFAELGADDMVAKCDAVLDREMRI